MNVKMVTMEDVLTTVPTHVEATSVLVDLAMSFRERMRGSLKVGLAVRVAVGIWSTPSLMLEGPVKVKTELPFYLLTVVSYM